MRDHVRRHEHPRVDAVWRKGRLGGQAVPKDAQLVDALQARPGSLNDWFFAEEGWDRVESGKRSETNKSMSDRDAIIAAR